MRAARARGVAAGALLLAASLVATPARAQDAPHDAPQDVPQVDPAAGAEPDAQPAAEPAAQPAALGPGEVASIDGKPVLWLADLDRYLGTVYARTPEGAAALDGLVGEALIEAAARERGLEASDADVEAARAGLEAQLRAASGGERGLADSLEADVDEAQLRATLRLQVLHERLVRDALGLPADAPVPVDELGAWLETAREAAHVEEAPLDDALAASWEGGPATAPVGGGPVGGGPAAGGSVAGGPAAGGSVAGGPAAGGSVAGGPAAGGSVAKTDVGRRLRAVLPERDVSGVLTEMIGVLLVRRAAARAGVSLTAAQATREVLDRDALLRARPGMAEVGYEQFVLAVQKRSLEEVLTSDKFGAEVLLRLLSERRHSEQDARTLWEADPAAWPGPSGPADTWEEARPIVWQALRERLYRDLFAESTIVRRS